MRQSLIFVWMFQIRWLRITRDRLKQNFLLQYKRIAIRSKKQLRTDDIEHIVEFLNEEFEKYAMSRLK